MSVRHRLEDAIILSTIGRKDGALLSALVAVAATSRLRFPEMTQSNWHPKEPMRDGEAFQTFLTEETESVYGTGLRLQITAPFPDPKKPSGSTTDLSHPAILYKYVRCALAHEGGLPHTVEFRSHADNALHASYVASENKFVFSENWLGSLVRAVVFAQENDAHFEEERKTNKLEVRQRLPLAVTRENLRDWQTKFTEDAIEIHGDYEAVFFYNFRGR